MKNNIEEVWKGHIMAGRIDFWITSKADALELSEQLMCFYETGNTIDEVALDKPEDD